VITQPSKPRRKKKRIPINGKSGGGAAANQGPFAQNKSGAIRGGLGLARLEEIKRFGIGEISCGKANAGEERWGGKRSVKVGGECAGGGGGGWGYFTA